MGERKRRLLYMHSLTTYVFLFFLSVMPVPHVANRNASPHESTKLTGRWWVEKYVDSEKKPREAMKECDPFEKQNYQNGTCYSKQLIGDNIIIDQGIEQILLGITGMGSSAGSGAKKKLTAFNAANSFMYVGATAGTVDREAMCVNAAPLGQASMLPGWPKLLNSVPDTACPWGSGGSDCGYVDTLEYKSSFAAGVATGAWNNLSLGAGSIYPQPCCGDCDGNGSVSVAEGNVCVNIQSGGALLSTCPPCDCDLSGSVSSGELILIALSQASGCFTGGVGSCLNAIDASIGTKGASDVWTVTLQIGVIP